MAVVRGCRSIDSFFIDAPLTVMEPGTVTLEKPFLMALRLYVPLTIYWLKNPDEAVVKEYWP